MYELRQPQADKQQRCDRYLQGADDPHEPERQAIRGELFFHVRRRSASVSRRRVEAQEPDVQQSQRNHYLSDPEYVFQRLSFSGA